MAKFEGDKTDVTALVRYAQSLEAEIERLRDRAERADAAIENMAIVTRDQAYEIERLRAIIKDAHEEMIAEKGEYHIKSGLGQTMAAVLQQTPPEKSS